jgi:DNA replication licensing factor MCM2
MSDNSSLSTPVHSESSDWDSGRPVSSESSGEERVDTSGHDSRADPAQDRCDGSSIDPAKYPQMTVSQRLDAQLAILRRQRAGRGQLEFPFGESDEDIPGWARRRPFRRRQTDDDREQLEELLRADPANPVTLQEQTGVLSEYLQRPEIQREVARRFQDFLIHYTGADGEPFYLNRFRQMGAQNLTSLEVSYQHFVLMSPIIGVWLGDAPGHILSILGEAAYELIQQEPLFPEFARIAPEIHVRITDLPIIDNIRDLRQAHLNVLVRTRGVVTKATPVFPQFQIIRWECRKCGASVGPFAATDETPQPPSFCPTCNARNRFRIDSANTLYRNYQRITIQEPPGSVPAGRLPRTKDVVLLADLTDSCRPGDLVEITGIYKHIQEVRRHGFPVFRTMIEANHVSRNGDAFAAIAITEEEKRQILELSRQPNVAKLIFDSIAPSIFGHDDIKAAIALTLFGGRRKDIKERHCVRGDINILLLGDPGTAKSQFLKYAERIAPRAVFTTGKGASAVGLTAAVHKDPVTGEWTLEGGALVLADGGVCLIDEFDKMSEKDRTSIHEAMEQQSISISKAGIVTTLLARCSIVAACNPIHGRYEGSLSFIQNSGLSEPILSRFDLICVVRDIVDPIMDARLAEAVIRAHQGIPPKTGLGEAFLRKYIAYARQKCMPRLSDIDHKKIVQIYQELRTESANTGGSPICVRHLESIIRFSEAHARLHLRSTVIDVDVNFAIAMVLESFVSTQKYADKKNLTRKFSKYLNYGEDRNDLLLHIAHTMVRERREFIELRRDPTAEFDRDLRIRKADFEARAQGHDVQAFHEFYECPKFKADFVHDDENLICRI